MKWEYDIATFEYLESRALGYIHSVRKLLDKFGQGGWELINIDHNVKVATFKRLITPEEGTDKND